MRIFLLAAAATALMSAPAMAQSRADDHAGHHPEASATAPAAPASAAATPAGGPMTMRAESAAQGSSDCHCPCAEMMRQMMHQHAAEQTPGGHEQHGQR